MRRGLTATTLVLALTTSGCGLFEQDDPRDDVESFAEALAAAKLSTVRFAGSSGDATQEWWDAVREGMGESDHVVQVASVAEPADDRATATLRHRWTLEGEGGRWSYDTTVDLVKQEEGWAVEPVPDAFVADLRKGETLDLSGVPAERADILGAGGRALVTERPVVRFGIDKTQVPPARAPESARKLATLLDVDPASFAERVEDAGAEAFVEAVVLRKEDVTPEVGGAYQSIPGARGIADEIPLAPTREFARAILGTVGPVTAEMVEDSDGAYAAGDVAGLSGLEARYDEQLRGRPGTLVEAVDTETGDERVLHEVEPQAGEPLRTTLDIELQLAAERVLRQVGPASALVAVRPSTGAVLAAASGPGSEGYATATVGQYAPGSTFKIVSSLALLRAGLSPSDQVRCPTSVVVDGKEFTNYSDYPSASLGRITLREAVARSCNTAFVSQHGRVTPEEVAQAAEALGLGTDYDVGFPSFFGEVPADGSTTEHAASLIGQGRVLASPMAMAAVAGSVAAGSTVVPHLVEDQAAKPDPARPLTAAEARQLRSLMAAVVADGSGRALADVPGPQVLAKTGTAEFGDDRPPKTHAWMVASQGDLAVAAFVEVGESGSRTAGPLLEELLRSAR